MKKMFLPLLFLFLSFFVFPSQAFSQSEKTSLKLPSIFGDNMVLQRDKPLPIWGWSKPGDLVSVMIGKETVSTKADEEGKWKAFLPSQKAGGPYTLSVVADRLIEIKNVMIGEVWICSGQSNMAWPVIRSLQGKEEASSARHEQIRLFQVERALSGKPEEDTKGRWNVCSPETVKNFSGVAYFFGRALHQKLNVPIGLVHTSWGGTRIEPWISGSSFEENEVFQGKVPALKKIRELPRMAAGKQKGILSWVQSPMVLYNAMVHPLIPFAFRGAIWYQGESNVHDSNSYLSKMGALIRGWRKAWGGEEFPFYYVQLAPFWGYRQKAEAFPKLCDEQRRALQAISNTGMAVTNDIGDLKDIHPQNKQEAGRRLALWALAKTYHVKNMVYSGPLFQMAKIEGSKMRVFFDHAGSGLCTRDGKDPTWFEVAGKDGVFHKAKAAIDGKTVVVESEEVKEPVVVRFAWDCQALPNLMNREGLPASCFTSGK